jgi:hypothetical protein
VGEGARATKSLVLLRAAPAGAPGPTKSWNYNTMKVIYLPMQKVEKMRLRMSSVVVAPVISSKGRSAP